MWTAEDLSTDVSAGEWIAPFLKAFTVAHGDSGVGSILPDAYDAYARVLHPAYRRSADHRQSFERVRWAEVARANSRIVHPLVEWDFLIPDESHVCGQPDVWDTRPATGSIDPRVAEALCSVLVRHTSAPEDCWYAIWDGNTALDDLGGLGGRMQIFGREYMLVRDEVEVADKELEGIGPSLWWPVDRAWCVSSDVDLMATYVGGTEACIAEIVDNPDLEAFPVRATDKITWDSDVVNPRPHDYFRRF